MADRTNGATLPRYRHVRTGGTYEVIGIGKMQADGWFSDVDWNKGSGAEVDMREVVLYRNVEHGTFWVRPRTEFESGRFEALEPAIGPTTRVQLTRPDTGDRMANPYRIEGPALISFSGGRTSAFMLWNIIQAHGGTLPDDVIVNFANTGKEREETLRFVHECGSRWRVHINWIEWRDKAAGFELVGYNSASRNGEPFQTLIDKKQRLPNWKERWCTAMLKVQPMTDYAASLGYVPGEYTEVIGLRHDEGMRIIKGLANAEKRGRKCAYPLSKAKAVKADVMAFWSAQDFDLGLEPWEGNCDLCFLKGRAIKKQIIRNSPESAAWWSANESKHKGKQERGWFDKRDSIAGLFAEAAAAPTFFEDFDPEEYDVECGLTCGEAA